MLQLEAMMNSSSLVHLLFQRLVFCWFYGSMTGFGAICICWIAAPRREFSKQRHLDVQGKKRRNLGEISSQITGHNVNYCRAGHIDPLPMMGSCFHLAFHHQTRSNSWGIENTSHPFSAALAHDPGCRTSREY